MGTPQRPVARKRQKNRRRKKEARLLAAKIAATVTAVGSPAPTIPVES